MGIAVSTYLPVAIVKKKLPGIKLLASELYIRSDYGTIYGLEDN
jgi:hypothetical protein